MPEPSIDDLKDKFAIPTQIKDTQLTFCLNGAIRDVKRAIGVDAYNEIFSGTTPTTPTIYDDLILDQDSTTTNEVSLRTDDVTDACYFFAASNLILNTSIRLHPKGTVQTETSNESPGMNHSASVKTDYVTPKDAGVIAGQLRSQGDRLLAPYIVYPAEQGDSFSVQVVRG